VDVAVPAPVTTISPSCSGFGRQREVLRDDLLRQGHRHGSVAYNRDVARSPAPTGPVHAGGGDERWRSGHRRA